jgi:uncharacterized GH25 family protein
MRYFPYLLIFMTASATAHDTWVETNTYLVRAGDAVYVDLKLGNHGNDHRDFKLASKVDLDSGSLEVILPTGQKLDLKPEMADVGYAPKEGYWTGKFVPGIAGTYTIAQSSDTIVNHGHPARSLKSAKTFFLVSATLDRVKDDTDNWSKPLGHPLEIVPVSHPILFTGPGMPIRIQVLLHGKPLADARVSFIPQGETLAEGFDKEFERMTDAEGQATFTSRTGSRYLICVHRKANEERTSEYDSTSYSATMTLLVPEVCPCCQ